MLVILNCFHYSFPISVGLTSLVFIVGRIITTLTHSFGITHLIFVFAFCCFGLSAKLVIAVGAHSPGVMWLIGMLTVDNLPFIDFLWLITYFWKLILILLFVYDLIWFQRSYFCDLEKLLQYWLGFWSRFILFGHLFVFEGKIALQTFHWFRHIVIRGGRSKLISIWKGLLWFVLLYQIIQLLQFLAFSWIAFKFLQNELFLKQDFHVQILAAFVLVCVVDLLRVVFEVEYKRRLFLSRFSDLPI